MTDWSGLAPAVDAYLRRWDATRRERPMIEAAMHGKITQGQLDVAPLLRQWVYFSRSYGLPQPDGSVAPGTLIVDGNGSIPTAVTDGATISGRQQFDEYMGGGKSEQAAWLASRELDILRDAIPHYVSAEVISEINDAAAEMGNDLLHETDVVTPFGFAVLEKPVRFNDLDPNTGIVNPNLWVAVRAFAWGRERVVSSADGIVRWGVTIIPYSTNQDWVDSYLASYTECYPDDAEHLRALNEIAMDGVTRPTELFPVDVLPWSFDRSWIIRPEPSHEPGTVIESVAAQRRWFLAFQRLMWQRVIIRKTPEHIKRAELRRWARTRPMDDLTVLRLRRVDNPEYEAPGTGYEMEHRVLVRGHWRNVYVPSLGGPARLPDGTQNPANHRLTWVEPHWRGPDDGPVRVPIHATSVVQ